MQGVALVLLRQQAARVLAQQTQHSLQFLVCVVDRLVLIRLGHLLLALWILMRGQLVAQLGVLTLIE